MLTHHLPAAERFSEVFDLLMIHGAEEGECSVIGFHFLLPGGEHLDGFGGCLEDEWSTS